MKIEYQYSRATGRQPRVEEALKLAIEASGADAEIIYTEVQDSEDAKHKRCLGSPTIRVEGIDVEYGEREPEEFTSGTRYYNTPEGWKPYPHVRLIANTIVEVAHRQGMAGKS
ncbi:MAG: hypothetical protein DYG91_10460 [Chloroflexi bacterium CFX7]|nr:hypothetical protein [Chloroflexi bacterium CFX7]MCK6564189.1 hypothetical protein [Dehalococcoidia bacterium]